MKLGGVLCVTFACILSFSPAVRARGVNGGMECAVCTVLLGLTEQLAEIHNETLVEASMRICNMLPYPLKLYCSKSVNALEEFLDQKFPVEITPDVMCYALGICYTEPERGFCHLFPKPKIGLPTAIKHVKKFLSEAKLSSLKYIPLHTTNKIPEFNICDIPGIKGICHLIARSFNLVAPALDVDQDWFSNFPWARGSFWRGRDCRDWDSKTYPGRLPIGNDVSGDSNCNGISGVNTEGEIMPLEDVLCKGTEPRGLIYIGDSVGAHFHCPEAWMDPKQLSSETLQNITQWIFNEGDWPQLGFATGYMNISGSPLIQGPTDSIYLRLRARNRCNHRDYQNLSRNGASTKTVLKHASGSLARNKTTDYPAFVIYGLFGNDVCNNYADTEHNMTTPKMMKENVMNVLERLNSTLPSGSNVLLIGLVDGSFIYPAMYNRLHPIGRFRQNVKYKNMYKWFTCMEIGPCLGWMTPNATLRKITSRRSFELSGVLKKIAEDQSFSALKIHYLDNPLAQVMQEWEKKGRQVWELIDPVDSLHPSQIAQSLITDVLWRNIEQKFPYILGDVNPHNAKIEELFGDQGGH
ncbi:acyloxyacyl hydrolase-like [Ischnura elegans]|uniref:acyloxyacyl hydrolase-like n=1 Tax=Ischnura elegans TaxID=197161 RepID=UPI001ED8B7DF|nr:acyloxyacyl hydrolase-like [Ischnura elegans]